MLVAPASEIVTWCSAKEPKALTTEGTEDHRGNRRRINVDLFDALH
jgi:hypothetical protein